MADLNVELECVDDRDLPIDIRQEIARSNEPVGRPSPETAPATTSAREAIAVKAAQSLLAEHEPASPTGLLACVAEAFACRLLVETDPEEAFLAGLLEGLCRQLVVSWVDLIAQLTRASPRTQLDTAFQPSVWRATRAVRAHMGFDARGPREYGYSNLSVSWAFIGATALAVDLLGLHP